jgi:hypothetical protein
MHMSIPIRPRSSFAPEALTRLVLLIEDVWNERKPTSSNTRHDQRLSRRREAFLTIVLLLIAGLAFVVMDKWIVPLSGSGHGLF